MEVTSVATEKYYTQFVPTRSAQAIHKASNNLFCCEDIVVHGKLGHGYFASVFLVRHRPTNRLMAMKLTNEASEQRREMDFLSALNHVNVLKLYGSCIIGARFVCLTEFANGGSLSGLLSAKAVDLPWSVRIQLALDIALGLEHLHSHGLIHRDLSSANIFIHIKLQQTVNEPASDRHSHLCIHSAKTNPVVEQGFPLNYGVVLCDSGQSTEVLPDSTQIKKTVNGASSPTQSIPTSPSYPPPPPPTRSSYPASCISSGSDVAFAVSACRHYRHQLSSSEASDYSPTGDDHHEWPLPCFLQDDEDDSGGDEVLACSLWNRASQLVIDRKANCCWKTNSPTVDSLSGRSTEHTGAAAGAAAVAIESRASRVCQRQLLRLPTVEPLWKQPSWLVSQNLTGSRDGAGCRPQYTAVVGDLGLCLDINRENVDTVPLVGNPYYIAPECLNQLSPYTFAADIFAYGILVCELITRQVNDGARIPRTPEFGVAHQKLNVPPDCPECLRRLVLDCCLVDHTRRPQMALVILQLTRHHKEDTGGESP